MRLINTRTLVLEEYFGDQIPKYAILSHTWRDEEVTFLDWQDSCCRVAKKGFQKIQTSCVLAQRQSIEYLWVDTNCINKDSSAELSEAINSMFVWYQRSCVCFVYLDDFHYCGSDLVDFRTSRWFTRGWTLQELLAPENVQFFDASWTDFGTKHSLSLHISEVTSIDIHYLIHPDSIRLTSVAKRMSWVSTRSTTREEDIAYCLLGIFEINMPLLYGEGGKAFIRLQEEIIRHSNDHTIFCWFWPLSLESEETLDWHGCLAPRPIAFRDSGDFLPTNAADNNISLEFQLTNSGLRITLPLLNSVLKGFALVMLNAASPANHGYRLCLCLQSFQGKVYVRSRVVNRPLRIPRSWAGRGMSIYLAHERDPNRKAAAFLSLKKYGAGFHRPHAYAVFPISSSDSIKPQTWYTSKETHGPFAALEEGNKENLWYTQLKLETSEDIGSQIDFEATIAQPHGGTWDMTIQLLPEGDEPENESKAIIQQVPLSHNSEFAIKSGSNTTLVRPVLV